MNSLKKSPRILKSILNKNLIGFYQRSYENFLNKVPLTLPQKLSDFSLGNLPDI